MTASGPGTGTLLASPEQILERLFKPTGVPGVHIRSGAYEDIVEELGRLITRLRPEGAEVYRSPPVVSRALIEKAGYLKSFPHLLGCVCALAGDEAQIEAAVNRFVGGGARWTDDVEATDLLLAPAACYPIYPIAAELGTPPPQGFLFDVAGDGFRSEPSQDIDRLQSFRMREFVAVGGAEAIQAFRESWIARAPEIAGALVLPHRIEAASDPFFGRIGQMIGRFQVAQSLKFELLIPVRSVETPTACMSFNYHRDQFGQTWDIRTADGQPAHTACVAFGLDRLALALFATHGVEARQWPDTVRRTLSL
jgi:seryl-tRNA synthetase